jgi:predicted Zn finger-like uncharacterized protein
MIVVCTTCHARFRLADEKVGPRGVRIRCSKCQGIFEVRRPVVAEEAPPPPPFEVDLDESARTRAEAPDVSPPSPPDPFAMVGQSLVTSPAVDPFAGVAVEVAPPAHSVRDDPFAPPPPSPPSPPASTADPFASRTLLISSGAPPESVPHDDPFAAASPPRRIAEEPPSPFPDLGFAEGSTPSSPLEAPPPLPRREPDPVTAVPPQSPSPAPATEARVGVPGDAAGPAAVAGAVEDESGEKAAPTRRSARLHSLVVNSMSVAVLLALALGLLVYWRGEGRGPKFLQASGLGGQEEAGLFATQVSSGLYRTFDGRLLLFVRGSIRIGPPSAPARIRVRADLLQGEDVVATGEGPAGALPSPEELAAISGPQDAERLRALLEQRAPSQTRVGDQLPFLVLFTEYPSDIDSIRYRVTAVTAVTAAAN